MIPTITPLLVATWAAGAVVTTAVGAAARWFMHKHHILESRVADLEKALAGKGNT